MSSLPEELETPEEELEPITAQKAKRIDMYQNRSDAKPISLALILSLLGLVMNAVVFSVAVDKPIERIASLFSDKESQQRISLDDQQKTITDILQKITLQASSTAEINNTLRSSNLEFSDFKNELIKHGSSIAQLERRYQEVKADIALMNKPKQIPKPITDKPKKPAKPIVLASLASIRSQGGTAWVSLREGLETSPLLMAGDEWRDYKIVSVDPIKKDVHIAIDGTTTLVKL